MELIDKLVLQTEQEIAEIKRTRESLENSIQDTQRRIGVLKAKENEARKLYKTLRAKQPSRSHMPETPKVTTENPTIEQSSTSSATSPSNNGKPDYQGAIELLREEGKEFTASEFAELSGSTYQRAAGYLHTMVNRKLAERTVSGPRGGHARDTSKFKIA